MAEEMHDRKISARFSPPLKLKKKGISEGNNQENNWGNLMKYSYFLNILRYPE